MITPDQLSELEEAAIEEGTELGEYWRSLLELHLCSMISDSFKRAVRQELAEQYLWFKNYAEWVEEEREEVSKKRTVRYLRFKF